MTFRQETEQENQLFSLIEEKMKEICITQHNKISIDYVYSNIILPHDRKKSIFYSKN